MPSFHWRAPKPKRPTSRFTLWVLTDRGGTTSAAQEQRNATEVMIRSAGTGLFGTAGDVMSLAAVGIGAAAVQWPTVSHAASGNNAGSGSAAPQTNNDGGGADGDDSAAVISATISSTSNLAASAPLVFAGLGSTSGSTQTSQTTQNTQNTSNTPASISFYPSNQALAQPIQAQAAIDLIAILLAADNSHMTGLRGISANTSRYRLTA